MFRMTVRRLAISPFSLFMMEQKANPALTGLPIARRGRMLGRLYRGLSPRDRAALEKRAAKHPDFKRAAKKRHSPSPYQQFFAKHSGDAKLRNLSAAERTRKIANMWRAKKGMPPVKYAKKKVAKKSKKVSKAKKVKIAKKSTKGKKVAKKSTKKKVAGAKKRKAPKKVKLVKRKKSVKAIGKAKPKKTVKKVKKTTKPKARSTAAKRQKRATHARQKKAKSTAGKKSHRGGAVRTVRLTAGEIAFLKRVLAQVGKKKK